MSFIPNFSQPLSDRLLGWIKYSVDQQAEIVEIRPLEGGSSSTLHLITLQTGEISRELVLRQYDNAEWLGEEPDLARHEAASLLVAARTGLPTPHLIAVAEKGEAGDFPALLMTKLPGSVVLRPLDIAGWLEGLAETLAKIHALEAADFSWHYFPYINPAEPEIPAWSRLSHEWRMAAEILKGQPPDTRPCFIHRDYHPVNVLWQEGKVSGVVDWPSACRGPAGVDLGHCRVELAQLYDVATADAFLEKYRRLAGARFSYQPYWDILALFDILFGPPQVYPGWLTFGFTGLTEQLLMEKLDAYLLSLLKRAGVRP